VIAARADASNADASLDKPLIDQELAMAAQPTGAHGVPHAQDAHDSLRHVRLETGHTLRTWDTGRTDSRGRTRIGYELSAPDGAVLFHGTDFRCSPLHAIDSDESLRALCGFLFLRPGDTDREYFADYTSAQRTFAASSDCEYLAFLYDEGGDGELVDVDDAEGGGA
jgi:hypothetical protein